MRTGKFLSKLFVHFLYTLQLCHVRHQFYMFFIKLKTSHIFATSPKILILSCFFNNSSSTKHLNLAFCKSCYPACGWGAQKIDHTTYHIISILTLLSIASFSKILSINFIYSFLNGFNFLEKCTPNIHVILANHILFLTFLLFCLSFFHCLNFIKENTIGFRLYELKWKI